MIHSGKNKIHSGKYETKEMLHLVVFYG